MKPFALRVVQDFNNPYPESGRIRNGADAASYLNSFVFDKDSLWREQTWVLTLDKSCNVSGVFLLSLGGADSTSFDKRLVAKAALDTMSDKVVVAHNHPSGNAMPSQHDIRRTDELRRALSAFGVELTDHVILGEKKFYSFSEEVERAIPKFKKNS